MTDYAIFAQCVICGGYIDPVLVLFNAVQKKRTFWHLVVVFLVFSIMPNRGHDGRSEDKKAH